MIWMDYAPYDPFNAGAQRAAELEGQRIQELERQKREAEVIRLPPHTVTAAPYNPLNPFDNPLAGGMSDSQGTIGPSPTNPFDYPNPYHGPLPIPTSLPPFGAPELMLPVTTDPNIIGAIDPKTGLPYRHNPDPVELEEKDKHPVDPMGPKNPTIYPPGGLLGGGVDVGIPGLISVGGLLGAGGGLLGLGGDMGGLFGGGGGGGSSYPAPQTPNQPTTVPVVLPGNSPSQPPPERPVNETQTLPVIPNNQPPPNENNNPVITIPPIIPPNSENPRPVTVPPPIQDIGEPPTIPFTPENTPPTTVPVIPTTPTVPTTPTIPTVPSVPTTPGGPPPPTTPPTTMPLPLDRNYYREGNQTNVDNSALLPGIFQNYQNYSGDYGQTDQANFAALLQALGINNSTLTGFANQQTASGNTALRTGNVADASNLGGQALRLLQGLNPNMYGALNRTNTAAGTTGQPSDIQTTLEQQAREGLALGGQLSAEDNRLAQQAAREAWSARGLVNSPGAIADEVLNRDSLARQRLAERQALASAVDQQGFSQRQQGFGNQIQNSLLQMQGAFNPFQTITSANTTNQGSNQQLFNQGAGFSSGSFGNQNVNSLVNPFNPYAQDVYNSNYNAANARYISQGNNAAAMAGARDAATGDIANSFLRLIGGIYGAS